MASPGSEVRSEEKQAKAVGTQQGREGSALRKEIAGLRFAEQQRRLAPGATGTLRRFLGQQGLLPDDADAAQVEPAVRAFQQGAGLSPDGALSEGTVSAMEGAAHAGADKDRTATDASSKTRSAERAPKAIKGEFLVNGQAFPTLAAVQDWLETERPGGPVIHIRLTPGSVIRVTEQTLWHHYDPHQKIVLDGQGASVTGLVAGRPTVGYFLSYRPVVGEGTTQDRPAAANLEVKNITIRGFESGGIEISPVTAPGKENQWDGGRRAFVSGASIHDSTFKGLGSKRTAPGEAVYGDMRFGAGGILMRGVQDSRIEDNVFSHLENGEVEGTEYGPRLIHAVYLRDNSSGNTVRGNRFEHTSGDPVRVSNGSNDNRVVGNSTKNTGVQALVSHWYSTGDPNNVQAPSTGTVIKNNELGSLYGKSRKAKDIHHKVAKAVPTPVNV